MRRLLLTLAFLAVFAAPALAQSEISSPGGGGGGGSGTVASGTVGQIPVYTGATTVGDSVFTQAGDATNPRLLLGGSTSSFPGLRRNATTIEVKLADDSAFTSVSSSTHVLNGATSGTVTVAAPATVTSYTFTLPEDDGTPGYVLSTDGSGATSWIAQSGGGLSGLTTDALPVATSATTVGDSLFSQAGDATTPRLLFGGSTSGHAALERNGTSIDARLGDDSGAANLSGAVVTASTALRAADGGAFAPTIAFTADATSGWWRQAASQVGFALGGAGRHLYTQSEIRLRNSIALTFTSSDANPAVTSSDVGVGRSAISSTPYITVTDASSSYRGIRHLGAIYQETATDPAGLTAIGSAGANVAQYVKNDKLVFAVNIGGTVNYLTLDLDGADTSWSWSTTAP